MKQYYPTIGLEIHAELNTKSKMFCGCKNDPNETEPNINICPVCMAHPGTLPVANKKAIESVIKVGLALGADIADFSEFDRKHYFYPDIPKGYQLSQYKYPIVSGGVLNSVAITRIHIEEDTANSKHDRGNFTLVDYNRAGVPLMELVTEPVIHSAKQAADFARELQLLFRYLNVSEANMEKGEMRVEANISLFGAEEGEFGLNQFGEFVDRTGSKPVLGTKVEVKNLNSFKSVEKAIAYELARMEAMYEAGRKEDIVQETRGWDEVKQLTFSQRSKENANDYRYFPDPDLPKMKLHSAFDLTALKDSLSELPSAKRVRYAEGFGLKSDDIEVFINDTELAIFFEAIAVQLKNTQEIQIAANYILSDVLGFLKKNPDAILPHVEHFSELIMMITGGEITSRGAKDVLLYIFTTSVPPRTYAESMGLLQQNDESALEPIIKEVIKNNEKIVADYQAGKEVALQALVGQTMKMTKGSANPEIVKKLLIEILL